MKNLKAGQYKLTRQLPKTGQTVQYAVGDDGTYEAGWWLRRLNANNRTRFLARTIGGDDIVLDRATGLMWAADGLAAGCNNGATITWAAAITYANGLNFAGFTDWRVPNINEKVSLADYSKIVPPCINTVLFPNTPIYYFWSSTTKADLTTEAHTHVYNTNHSISNAAKSTDCFLRCVRKGA